jgi:hypothetical protein
MEGRLLIDLGVGQGRVRIELQRNAQIVTRQSNRGNFMWLIKVNSICKSGIGLELRPPISFFRGVEVGADRPQHFDKL